MKFPAVLVCLMMAICVNGAPQAGPPLGLPPDSYSPQCRPPPCPSTGNVKFGFPLDCLQYVECTKGVSVVKACPPDMVWHEASGNCANRDTAECKRCW